MVKSPSLGVRRGIIWGPSHGKEFYRNNESTQLHTNFTNIKTWYKMIQLLLISILYFKREETKGRRASEARRAPWSNTKEWVDRVQEAFWADGSSTLWEWVWTQGCCRMWAKGSRSKGWYLRSLLIKFWAPEGNDGGNLTSTWLGQKRNENCGCFLWSVFSLLGEGSRHCSGS